MARFTPVTPINSAEMAGEIAGKAERQRRRAQRQAANARENRARANARAPRKKKRKARNTPAPAPAPAAPPRVPPGGGRPWMMRRHAPEEDVYDEEEYEDDEEYEEYEEEYEDDEDLDAEYLSGMRVELGRALPRAEAKALWERIRDRVRARRVHRPSRQARGPSAQEAPAPLARTPSPRPAPAPTPTPASRTLTETPTWGPAAWLGKNIILQVRNGHRAMTIQLRPGLWILAEVPDVAVLPTTEGGFGLAPLLAPAAMLATKVALRAQERRERREAGEPGLLRRLLRPGEARHPALPGPGVPSTSQALAGCCAWCDEGDGQ